jgi:rhamnose transport system ATP-binding protein
MSEIKNVIEISNVSKTYVGVRALADMHLSIQEGEVHALVGENGAGKSTLIKILAGVETPNEGAHIVIGGETCSRLTPLISTQRGISVIFQDFSLFPNLSVSENIVFANEVMNKSKFVNAQKITNRAKALLDEIGLDIDTHGTMGTYSVAKQQMVAIARALALDAKLIIMDEPTSTLSGAEVEHLFQIINNMKKKGISIIFVSHKLDELFMIADRFTVMRDGKYIGTYKKEELNEDKLVSLMVGRKVEVVKHEESKRGKKILEVEGLSLKGNYEDISFALHEGEILGLTGLVGSGRTEVVSTIFGLTGCDRGVIRVDGKPVKMKSPEQAKKLGIALVPEDRHNKGIIGSKSLIQNTSITILDRMKNRFRLLDFKKEAQALDEQMSMLQITPKIPEMLASNLSGGNQQKLVLAKWLARNPRILIVDEPTNGIDVGAKREIHSILQRLRDEGVAILMISSELPEVLAVSDRIFVMRRGRLVAEFPNNVSQEAIINKAFFGKAEEYLTEAV